MKYRVQLIFPIITYSIGFASLLLARNLHISVPLADILCVIFLPLFSFFFYIYEKITKREIPILLNGLLCSEIILGVCGGSILNLYSYIPIYDLLLHAYFGFVGSIFLYYILLKTQKELNITLLLFIILMVLGLAAIWEMCEYTMDTVFSMDTQRVQEALEKGISPVKDTMGDMIITLVGIVIFYLSLYIDKKWNNVLYGSLIKSDGLGK